MQSENKKAVKEKVIAEKNNILEENLKIYLIF